MNEPIPWGISRIGCIYHPDVQAGLPDGRWVAAVAEPYPCNFFEAVRAAWWVLTGKAHAIVWPRAGDLEAIWARENPTLRDRPLPFVPRKRQFGDRHALAGIVGEGHQADETADAQ